MIDFDLYIQMTGRGPARGHFNLKHVLHEYDELIEYPLA